MWNRKLSEDIIKLYDSQKVLADMVMRMSDRAMEQFPRDITIHQAPLPVPHMVIPVVTMFNKDLQPTTYQLQPQLLTKENRFVSLGSVNRHDKSSDLDIHLDLRFTWNFNES